MGRVAILRDASLRDAPQDEAQVWDLGLHRPSGIFTSSNSKLVCKSSTCARDSHIAIQPRPGCWAANRIADFSGAALTAQSRLSLWCSLSGSDGGSAGCTGVILARTAARSRISLSMSGA